MALEELVALESGLEEFYQLRRPLFEGDVSQETCIALVVMKRQGGALVAAPLDFFSAEDKANMRMLGEASAVGPRTVLTVPAERETETGGREQVEDLSVVVFDLDVSMVGHLTPIRVVSSEAQDFMMAFLEGDPSVVPESDGLVRFVREWVSIQTGEGPGHANLAFYSAVEEEDGKDEERVPETPAAGRRQKEPKPEKPKRVTTTMLADQLSTLMDAIPNITAQLVSLQEDQKSLRMEMHSQALVPPVRPSQMPISAGIPHLPDASNLAKLIGAPPKVRGSPPPMTVLSKPPPIQKGTDSQLNPQGQAEEVEEPGSVLASAVLEQSKALTSLVSHLQQGGDPLLGGQADSSGQSLSSKGMAQREKLQQQLASRSGGFFLAVLQNALRKVKPAARVPLTVEEASTCDFSMITYLERYGGYGASKELGLIQYVIAHVFDAAMANDMDGVRELVSLLMVGVEQGAMDGGRMDFAYKMMLLEEPPSQLWSYRQAAYDPRSRAFSPLAPQRWATCALAFSKEIDYIQSKRQEIAAKKAAPPPPDPESPNRRRKKFPKGGPKQKEEDKGS